MKHLAIFSLLQLHRPTYRRIQWMKTKSFQNPQFSEVPLIYMISVRIISCATTRETLILVHISQYPRYGKISVANTIKPPLSRPLIYGQLPLLSTSFAHNFPVKLAAVFVRFSRRMRDNSEEIERRWSILIYGNQDSNHIQVTGIS